MPPQQQKSPSGGMLSGARELPPWLVTPYVRRHATNHGARDVAILLQDYDQRVLVPITDEGLGEALTGGQAIDGTLAGRCFTQQRPVEHTDPRGETRLFLPLIDGGDR